MAVHIIISSPADDDPNLTGQHPFGALQFQSSAAKMPTTKPKKNAAAGAEVGMVQPTGAKLTPQALKNLQNMKSKARSTAIQKLSQKQA
jgi:hypothetical protein